MSRIRSRGNKDTELALVGLLRAYKISGWRRHVKVRVAVEQSSLRSAPPRSRWLSRLRVASPRQGVERRKRGNTSFGLRPPSPQSGEGATLVRHGTPQPSTSNPQLAVRPDFVFRKQRMAIFVDGCFWHGCPKHATWPAHRAAWWRRKIEGNKTRDQVVNRALRRAGWRVVRIWEHELQKGKHSTSNIQHSTFNVKPIVRRIHRALGSKPLTG